MTRNEILRRWPNAGESFIRRNLTDPAVGGLAAGEQQRSSGPALVSPRPQRQTRKGCVELIVTLITCRSREADDDNHIASCKPLRDTIAQSLELDDGDKRIRWEYGQIESHGQPGVIVRIETK